MTNLQKQSGLPIELTDDFHLKFGEPIKSVEPSIRKFADMIPVWMDQNAKPKPAIDDMYYMYRDVYLPEHDELIRKNNLRYDLTVIPAAMVGQEFNKTVGHYHPLVPGEQVAYPEMYEVIKGEALFLIQKVEANGSDVQDFQVIQARAGEKVIYPPNYAHIIVNIGAGPLVTANWTASIFESLYAPIRDHHGMAYYVVKDAVGKYSFVKNQNYSSHPEVRMVRHEEKIASDFGFISTEPMYLTGTQNSKKLEFLVKPQLYLPELARLTS